RDAARAGGGARRRRCREDPAPRGERAGARRAAHPAEEGDLVAETATIARPYAEAVFGLADKSGTLAKWSQLLAALAAAAADPQVRALIGDPKVREDQLYGLFA